MRIKVDYSESVKKSGKHNVPGEFAIYTKTGIFGKWIQGQQTYADYDFACRDAKKMREHIVPRYF